MGLNLCRKCTGHMTLICKRCDGYAKVIINDLLRTEPVSLTCMECSGTGVISCPVCKGTGTEHVVGLERDSKADEAEEIMVDGLRLSDWIKVKLKLSSIPSLAIRRAIKNGDMTLEQFLTLGDEDIKHLLKYELNVGPKILDKINAARRAYVKEKNSKNVE